MTHFLRRFKSEDTVQNAPFKKAWQILSNRKDRKTGVFWGSALFCLQKWCVRLASPYFGGPEILLSNSRILVSKSRFDTILSHCRAWNKNGDEPSLSARQPSRARRSPQ